MSIRAVLFRGEVKVDERPEHEETREIRIYHQKPFIWSEPRDFDSLAEMQCWQEIFVRNQNFQCPCCGAVIFSSKNYMEAPEWLAERFAKRLPHL